MRTDQPASVRIAQLAQLLGIAAMLLLVAATDDANAHRVGAALCAVTSLGALVVMARHRRVG